jgi:hypothetical protein
MAAKDSPGYLEVFQASREDLAAISPGSEKFYWMLAKRVRNQIVKGEGELEGWREIVVALISERVWEKLLRRHGGEPYGSLAAFIKDGLEMSIEQFAEGVARYAGPDCLNNTVRPHLPELKAKEEERGVPHHCYNDVEPQGSSGADWQEALGTRRIAEAPALAIQLQANGLITKEDIERLGRLAREGKHNEASAETLELILDRIEDLGKPSVTASSTERRLFRGKVREVIQAVLPAAPSLQQTKPVRLPTDPAGIAAWLKKTLAPEDLAALRHHLCNEETELDTASSTAQPKNRKVAGDLEVGSFASNAQVGELVGACLTGSANTRLIEKIKTDPANESLRTCTGNGWTFRKWLREEVVQLGYTDKSPSWEVVQVGQL